MNMRMQPDGSEAPGVSSKAEPAKCRICGCRLGAEEQDDFEARLCQSCQGRPEAKRLGIAVSAPIIPGHADRIIPAPSRGFTAAEISLISKVHSKMPAQQLLDLLNERLACDLGPDAVQYTLEQLQRHIDVFVINGGASRKEDGSREQGNGRLGATSRDWASLRKLLGEARRSGVLANVSEQVVIDFAVVYSLSPKQLIALRDIVLPASED